MSAAQTVPTGGVGSRLAVSEVQRGNPLLNSLRNVAWAFTPGMVADYATANACAIYVTVQYHLQHPQHVLRRFSEVGTRYRTRILLVYVDDPASGPQALATLSRLAFQSEFSLLAAWSYAEAARYLETMKAWEAKPPTLLQSRQETEFLPRVTSVLTNAIRPVNKSDVVTLLGAFGTLNGISNATEEQLRLCPGLGDKKVAALYAALHAPLVKRTGSTTGKSTITSASSNATSTSATAATGDGEVAETDTSPPPPPS